MGVVSTNYLVNIQICIAISLRRRNNTNIIFLCIYRICYYYRMDYNCCWKVVWILNIWRHFAWANETAWCRKCTYFKKAKRFQIGMQKALKHNLIHFHGYWWRHRNICDTQWDVDRGKVMTTVNVLTHGCVTENVTVWINHEYSRLCLCRKKKNIFSWNTVSFAAVILYQKG